MPEPSSSPRPWRTGRKVGRTLYEQAGERPADSDPLIGVMDTPELAQAAVDAHNGVTPKPVGNVLNRSDVREIAYKEIARRAHADEAFKRVVDPLGAFTFFDLLDGICDAVCLAIESGGTYEPVP